MFFLFRNIFYLNYFFRKKSEVNLNLNFHNRLNESIMVSGKNDISGKILLKIIFFGKTNQKNRIYISIN